MICKGVADMSLTAWASSVGRNVETSSLLNVQVIVEDDNKLANGSKSVQDPSSFIAPEWVRPVSFILVVRTAFSIQASERNLDVPVHILPQFSGIY